MGKGEFIISATLSLIRAAADGNAQTVRKLLSDGADVNATNPGGQTALILAALMGRADIVRLLLEAGADVSRRDNLGLTAIDWAQRKGFLNVTHLLVSFSTMPPAVRGSATRPANADQEFRESDRVDDRKVTSESQARAISPKSESKADVGFGPAAIAMLKAKTRKNNHEAAATRFEPSKKVTISPEPVNDASSREQASVDASLSWTESLGGKATDASTEPETLRARMETERIFEEARLRVEQEVRKKTQEQAGSTFDREPLEEELPARNTVSESVTLKRCPKCNTIYEDDFRMYCAYDAGRLVNVDRPVEEVGASTFSRPTLWLMVAVTLVASAIVTYLATSYFIRKEASTPAAVATEKAPIAEDDSPVVGGALIGKELNVPKAEYPSTVRSTGASAIVTVVVRVNRNGRVTSARALNGDAQLRAAAEKAARKATFSPEKLASDERIVAGTITYTFKP